MKQKTFVSLIGAVCMLYAAMVSIGCDTAAGLPGDKNNENSNQKPDSSNNQNNQDSGDNPFAPAPTGEADAALAETQWVVSIGKNILSFDFAKTGNTVDLGSTINAVYTINGSNILFDISYSVAAAKKLTVDSYIAAGKKMTEKKIQQLEGKIKKDPDNEELKRKLTEEKAKLARLQNPTEETKAWYQVAVDGLKKQAEALEKYTKFGGTFTDTTLTIKNYPVIAFSESGDVSVELKEVKLTKQVKPSVPDNGSGNNGGSNEDPHNGSNNQNNQDSGDNPFAPAPTDKADAALAETNWSSNSSGGGFLSFAKEGNTVVTNIADGQRAHYTVNGSSITFDISRSVAASKNLTLDSYIIFITEPMKKEIAEIKNQLNSGSLDDETKTKLEEELKEIEDGIEVYKNLTADQKKKMEDVIKTVKKQAEALEKGKHTKFEGTFTDTTLTIKNYPVIAFSESSDVSVTRQEVTFTKQMKP